MLLNGKLMPRNKELLKMERHQRALVWEKQRNWQNRKQSIALCVGHKFLPNSSSALGAFVKEIHESNVIVKQSYRTQ